MQIEIKQTENKKYLLLGTFEVGNSGTYEQRILCFNLSKKKAEELKTKYQK
jgi:hypothetical protein